VSIRSTPAQDRFFWITRRIFAAHKCFNQLALMQRQGMARLSPLVAAP
jgi:hypothetical protein